MKKFVWFVGLTLLVVIAVLIVGNWESIWKALLSLPVKMVLVYLGGAGTMLAANFLGGDSSSTKKTTPPSSNTAKKA